MYLTILSGQVKPENWHILEQSFSKGIKHCPNGLMETMLIHNEEDQNLWQIITLWNSKEDFEQAEREFQTNHCVQMFCDAGTTPHRQLFKSIRFYERV